MSTEFTRKRKSSVYDDCQDDCQDDRQNDCQNDSQDGYQAKREMPNLSNHTYTVEEMLTDITTQYFLTSEQDGPLTTIDELIKEFTLPTENNTTTQEKTQQTDLLLNSSKQTKEPSAKFIKDIHILLLIYSLKTYLTEPNYKQFGESIIYLLLDSLNPEFNMTNSIATINIGNIAEHTNGNRLLKYYRILLERNMSCNLAVILSEPDVSSLLTSDNKEKILILNSISKRFLSNELSRARTLMFDYLKDRDRNKKKKA